MAWCFIDATLILPMEKLTCLYPISAIITYPTAEKASSEASPKKCSSRSSLLVILYHLCTAIGLFCDNSKIQVLKVFCKMSSKSVHHCCPWSCQISFMIKFPLFERGTITPNGSNRLDIFDYTSLCVHCSWLSKKTPRETFNSSRSIPAWKLWVSSQMAFNLWIQLKCLKPIYSNWNSI